MVLAPRRGAHAALAGAALAAVLLAAPGASAGHFWHTDPYPPLPYPSCIVSGRADCIGAMDYVDVYDRHGNLEKVLNVRPRFVPRYAAPAYLADSPGPVIERRAVWEPWTDHGSVTGWPRY